MRKLWTMVAVLGVTLTSWAPASAYDAGEVNSAGSLKGSVRYVGTPPARTQFKVTKDTGVCARGSKSEELMVGSNRGIASVVIMLTIEKGKKWSADKLVLDQGGCDFHPHVLVVPTGADVEVLNPDGILHNFHTLSTKNPSVNRAMSKFKRAITVKFLQPEIIKVVCDTHDWMRGWLIVSEHPYVAVTDAQGNFEMKDIPAGTYKVAIWHETLGVETRDITVKAGQTVALDLDVRGTGVTKASQ